jgi:RNA ligase
MVDSCYLLEECSRNHTGLTITRKMDGMMGVLWNLGDQWGIATRGSFESDGAKFATEKWQKFVKYGATEFIPKGWTLIFEIIAKHLRIVVPYEWEGLCLLTAVNNATGEEMSYEQLHELWVNLNSYSKTLDKDGNKIQGKPWCHLVEKFDIDIATAEADPSKEEEGYVVSVNRRGLPPVKAKIKLSEYKRLHKILTGLTPQMIWEEFALPVNPWLAMDSKYDRKTGEVTHSMPVPAEFAAWVKQWQRGLIKAFHGNLVKAVAASDAVTWEGTRRLFKNDVERKDYLTTQGYERDIVTAALLLYNGREAEAYEGLWKLVRPFGRDDRFYVEGKGE